MSARADGKRHASSVLSIGWWSATRARLLAVIAVASAGAIGAIALAWVTRKTVGLDEGTLTCTTDPAWAGPVNWGLLAGSALLLLGLSASALVALRRPGRRILALPIFGSVAVLALAYIASLLILDYRFSCRALIFPA